MIKNHYCIIFLIGMILMSCDLISSDDEPELNGESEESATEYSLSVIIEPEEAGSVSPSTGNFEDGEEVEVEAVSNDGWEFEGWSGGIEADENPIIFTIEKDTELIANFRNISSQFSVYFSLTDEKSELEELEIGLVDNPDAKSREAPPNPPNDVLHAWFDRNSTQLFKDYRDTIITSVSWRLNYQIGSGEGLNLSWEIELSRMEGVISILADDHSVLIDDMSETEQFEITAEDDFEYLFINYELID